jgi:hypothetical protein
MDIALSRHAVHVSCRMALALAAAVVWGASSGYIMAAETDLTTITVTDKVILDSTKDFGINIHRDTASKPMLKKRLAMNFEGTLYQHMFIVAERGSDDKGVCVVNRGYKGGAWEKTLLKHPDAEFFVVSGPSRWQKLKLVDFQEKKTRFSGREADGWYLTFDKQIAPPPPWGGVVARVPLLKQGQLRGAGSRSSYYKDCEISQDTPPGSYGYSSCRLRGKDAHHTSIITDGQVMDCQGEWKLIFWAKGIEDDAVLLVGFGKQEVETALTKEWKRYEKRFTVKADEDIAVAFKSPGGAVLIDDIECTIESNENPTAFLDGTVKALKALGAGMPIRSGDICEGTIDNMLAPRLEQFQFTHSGEISKIGPHQSHKAYYLPMHEFYELCAYLKAEPWYIAPGIMTKADMQHLIEYLAAPADEGYGKLRAARGQTKPWTDVLKKIHIEIGNETWNLMFWGANCAGPDYWSDLVETAHSSPYYKKNISIVLNARNANSRYANTLRLHPKADAYDWAPYIIHRVDRKFHEALDTDEKVFRWVFGEGIRYARKHNRMAEAIHKIGKEYTIYEINHHLMYGYSPVELTQKFQVSVGGGINIANSMMLHLKENQARTQCLFAGPGGGKDKRKWKGVWGTIFSTKKGREMYHPVFLTVSTINKAIGGDLLETTQTGHSPTFLSIKPDDRRTFTEEPLPVIWSYAFKDGSQRSLALFNLNSVGPQRVKLDFPGVVGGKAKAWLLTSEKITDANWLEDGQAKVKIREDVLEDFQSGSLLTLPPFSVQVLRWQE